MKPIIHYYVPYDQKYKVDTAPIEIQVLSYDSIVSWTHTAMKNLSSLA